MWCQSWSSHLSDVRWSQSLSLVFTSPDGTPLRRSNFNRRVWQVACGDARHLGSRGSMTSGTPATPSRPRPERAQRSSWPGWATRVRRAALIYQHATLERDRALADALSKLASGPRSASRAAARSGRRRRALRFLLLRPLERVDRAPRTKPDQTGGDDGTRTHDPLLAKQVL